MPELLIRSLDLALVIFGFGLVIVIHELGHFLAARWAKVRVHEFAVGFGPSIFAYRKGLGLRRGSTSEEYERLARDRGLNPQNADIPGVSPTEYRLNWIPLGGYVKMLGQEDLAPGAQSESTDSYNTKPVWKRLIIISAGVVMNVILAAVLFIAVFMVGLDGPPATIGSVQPGSAASEAVAVNAEELGVTKVGLQPRDRVVSIGDQETLSFKDIAAAAGLAKRGRPLDLTIDRPGVDEPLRFLIEPRESDVTRLLELGVAPPISTTIHDPRRRSQQNVITDILARLGYDDLAPGMRMVSLDGEPVETLNEVAVIFREADGSPMRARFEDERGGAVEIELSPTPRLQETTVDLHASGRERVLIDVRHLLGLTPPMTVLSSESTRARRAGLETGDIFARIGRIDWPNSAQGIAEIRRHAGRSVPLVVVRDGQYLELESSVDGAGRIGIGVGQKEDDLAIVTRPPRPGSEADDDADARRESAAERLNLLPGSTILRVNGAPVTGYAALRAELRRATASALEAGSSAEATLTVRLPIGEGFNVGETEEMAWLLEPAEIKELHALGWSMPLDPTLFEVAMTTLKADGPFSAIAMGYAETKRIIVMTYVTMLRLFEGTVHVEHLKGPVGIVHIGTLFIDQGMIHLLFLFAIISANLAVLNFLPLPIVDGGHAVFLIIEGITGKPVSVAVQNVATLIGLALIGTLFLVVTYHDIVALFG
ncbi:MAG: hypothetical protein EA376_06465 [Phycisphaeraceae bacterium]|nr:MAG: hypothetical protein EA376_06465 [Phycisphaeraceae bacterium]